MWLWFAIGSAVFAGLTAILAKVGIRHTPSNLATALRTVIVLAFAWLMVFIVGSQDTIGTLSSTTWVFLVLSGLATGASWLCYFRALQLADVNQVTPIDRSSVVLSVLFAIVLLGETDDLPTRLGGIALIGVGTYLMIDRPPTPQGSPARSWTWLLFAAGSAVFAALTAILGKVGITDVESNLGTAIRTVVVLALAWVVVFLTGEQRALRRIDRRDGWFIAASGVATGASWLCFYHALQSGPASLVVPIDKLSIVVTIAFAALFLRERLTTRSVTGLALLVGGTLVMLV